MLTDTSNLFEIILRLFCVTHEYTPDVVSQGNSGVRVFVNFWLTRVT
jgi:hypothetical protein